MADLFPLAWSTLGSPGWSFEHTVEQAATSGYRGLEVRLLDGEIVPADIPAARRAKMKAALAQHNVQIVAFGVSTRFSSPDAAERAANAEMLKRYIDLAADMGVPMVRTFGGNVAEGHSLDATIDWVAQGMNATVSAADAQGVDIVIETHDAFCRGAEVARVFAQVPNLRFGTVWDVHHPFRMGESLEETWRLVGPRVKHVHIKDGVRRPDGSWQLVLLGQGEVPCRQAVELLAARGYRGFITAEWEKKWHPEIEEPEVAMPQHAEVLRQWFAEVGQEMR
jgi:sugar phosphate isomerase/epimerase